MTPVLDPFGPVRSLVLRLRGPVAAVTMRDQRTHRHLVRMMRVTMETLEPVFWGGMVLPPSHKLFCWLDDYTDPGHDSMMTLGFYLLLLCTAVVGLWIIGRSEPVDTQYRCLMLLLDTKSGSFKRIGMLHLGDDTVQGQQTIDTAFSGGGVLSHVCHSLNFGGLCELMLQ